MHALNQQIGELEGTRGQRLFRLVALLVLILSGLALWIWNHGAERRAVSRLPGEQRASLYESTLAGFMTLCAGGPRRDSLEKQCREGAAFLLEFPECDAHCRELTKPHVEPRTAPR